MRSALPIVEFHQIDSPRVHNVENDTIRIFGNVQNSKYSLCQMFAYPIYLHNAYELLVSFVDSMIFVLCPLSCQFQKCQLRFEGSRVREGAADGSVGVCVCERRLRKGGTDAIPESHAKRLEAYAKLLDLPNSLPRCI